TAIPGPGQVQNAFSSNSQVAQTVNILRRGDSDVVYGNLLTLPVGGGLLYVEPVYVQAATGTSYPLLRKVLVGWGENVAFADTLQEALDSVFQGNAGAPTGEGAAPGGAPVPVSGELRTALQDAQDAMERSRDALQKGDFAAYGQAQEDLRSALERAVVAEQQAEKEQASTRPESPAPSPEPTTSPGGTGGS
ncbi:MAG: UPF0182 family protein, partial [Carbonactinosporaceae bacterium]